MKINHGPCCAEALVFAPLSSASGVHLSDESVRLRTDATGPVIHSGMGRTDLYTVYRKKKTSDTWVCPFLPATVSKQ